MTIAPLFHVTHKYHTLLACLSTILLHFGHRKQFQPANKRLPRPVPIPGGRFPLSSPRGAARRRRSSLRSFAITPAQLRLEDIMRLRRNIGRARVAAGQSGGAEDG